MLAPSVASKIISPLFPGIPSTDCLPPSMLLLSLNVVDIRPLRAVEVGKGVIDERRARLDETEGAKALGDGPTG